MKNKYDQRHGLQYRFFVTEDAKTWETTQAATVPQDIHQSTQEYPAPPPNQQQLQPPIYTRPAPVAQAPRIQIRAPPNRSGPRGIQVLGANRVPLGGQGRINCYYHIADALVEDDEVDREMEANDGLPRMNRHQQERTNWADDQPTDLSSAPPTTPRPVSLSSVPMPHTTL